ncbi:MAG: inositol monophosphatase [Verrucomicrobia bacterium]|nr:inositol monophosphatase [Verrucomicrobiota bacterium]
MNTLLTEEIRRLLLELGDQVRNAIRPCARSDDFNPALSSVSRQSAADTIYGIDRVGEEAIADWFHRRWPGNLPVELVMEGIDPEQPLTFPAGTSPEKTEIKIVLDPIDGTRGIMYDKRPAWFLAGAAPQHGISTRLSEIEVAVMVELPTLKQWRADRFSAIRGRGVLSDSVNVLTGAVTPRFFRPSQATDMLHGFGYISRFLPAGKALLAAIEQRLWEALYSTQREKEIIVFEDQYIATGGQFYELLTGHDRMTADIRPLVFKKLGLASALCCHPYDVAAALVLQEAGVIVEDPAGTPLEGPLDTTSPSSWVGYANATLADHIRPAFQAVLREMLEINPAEGRHLADLIPGRCGHS